MPLSRSLQPLIIVANKSDVKKISELSEENQVSALPFRFDRQKHVVKALKADKIRRTS